MWGFVRLNTAYPLRTAKTALEMEPELCGIEKEEVKKDADALQAAARSISVMEET
jgi:hypothetical protein